MIQMYACRSTEINHYTKELTPAGLKWKMKRSPGLDFSPRFQPSIFGFGPQARYNFIVIFKMRISYLSMIYTKKMK